MKYLRLYAFVAAHHCFQMVQAFFSASLFEVLKRLVAELALDKQILKDIAEGNF
jgi:hypothetical protein